LGKRFCRGLTGDVWYEVTEDTFLCTNVHDSHKHALAFSLTVIKQTKDIKNKKRTYKKIMGVKEKPDIIDIIERKRLQ
jgi:hypothetical protein